MAITQIVTRLIANAAVTLTKLGIFTTKGDVLGYDGSNNNRLAVGSDGFVLTADAASTNGIKWATPAFSSANFVFNETPTGTVNGTNPTFTLANTPTAGTVQVYVDGVHMNAGASNDYTIATATITFLSGAIPQTGDVILVSYMK